MAGGARRGFPSKHQLVAPAVSTPKLICCKGRERKGARSNTWCWKSQEITGRTLSKISPGYSLREARESSALGWPGEGESGFKLYLNPDYGAVYIDVFVHASIYKHVYVHLYMCVYISLCVQKHKGRLTFWSFFHQKQPIAKYITFTSKFHFCGIAAFKDSTMQRIKGFFSPALSFH